MPKQRPKLFTAVVVGLSTTAIILAVVGFAIVANWLFSLVS